MGLRNWCNRLIKSGYFLLFALVPLLLTPWNYELFEYNKMMAVYALTVLIAAAWVTKILSQKEVRITKTPLDIPIVLFTLSQLVSAVFSMDPHVSWFGYYSRFNGGMWSVISYVILYYGFVSNTDAFAGPVTTADTSHIKHQGSGKHTSGLPVANSEMSLTHALLRLLKISVFTATVIAIYAVLEHMGIDKHIWVQDVQNRVFSTLGQPNWLAAYLVALTPVAMTFFLSGWQSYREKKTHSVWDITFWMWGIISVLFFLVLLFTRSRSGLLGLAVADVIFWAVVIIKSRKSPAELHGIVKPAVIVHLLFALVVFFNGTYIPQLDKYVSLNGLKAAVTKSAKNTVSSETPASPSGYVAPALETGGTESGTIRKYVWEAAISAWKNSTKTKLIGTGTETFAFAFYQFRPVAHNMTSEWDFLYNKAHNEYLNYLATTGAFGLGSYLLLLCVFVWWFIKHETKRTADPLPDTRSHDILISALFAGWVSVLVTNFFGFSVVVTQLIVFLFPVMAFLLARDSRMDAHTYPVRLPQWFAVVPGVVAVWLLFTLSSYWYADKQFAHGYQYDRAGMYDQATPSLMTAIAINPAEPMYHDELSSAYAELAVSTFSAKNATQAAQLAELALGESDKAIHISPQNVNFLKTRTKVYYTLSTLDPSFNSSALTTLQQAAKLSPNDPKIYYNLAILAGREGLNDQAVSYLLKAKALKPDYRDAYNALNIFYTEMGQKDNARAILEEYLTRIDPNDSQFKEALTK